MMHAAILPFSYESNTELCERLSIELPSHLTDLPHLNLDENLIHAIESKYHSISDKNNINLRFSFFHVNIRSLTKHFEEPHSLLKSTHKFLLI